jgi:hypothetical protein
MNRIGDPCMGVADQPCVPVAPKRCGRGADVHAERMPDLTEALLPRLLLSLALQIADCTGIGLHDLFKHKLQWSFRAKYRPVAGT